MPDEDDFGDRKKGPKPEVAFDSVCANLNKIEHIICRKWFAGFKKVIIAKRKIRAKAKGMCKDSAKIEPSDSTVALYDRMATFFDPNISLVDPEMQG